MGHRPDAIDPLRDLKMHGAKLAVDATSKGAQEGHPRQWPEELHHSAELIEKVTGIARELGLLG